MEIGTLFGLPAHPLLMHVPVLGIPLCALWVLLVAANARWRRQTAIPLAVFTIVIVLFTILTASAGEHLEEQVDRNALLERHTQLGDQTRTIVIVFGIVTLLFLLLDWISRRNTTMTTTTNDTSEPAIRRSGPWKHVILTIGVVAVLLGGVATVWDVRTGHSGATATWSDVSQQPPQQGDGN